MNLANMTINPFDGKPGKLPEVANEIEVEQDSLVYRTLKEYPLAKSCCEMKAGSKPIHELYETVSELELEVLSPGQIDLVLQGLLRSEGRPFDTVASLFVNRLIQNSYDAGHNDFVLTLDDAEVPLLGDMLKGSSRRELQLKIIGHAGIWCGSHSEYGSFTIEGDVENWCGSDAKNSRFLVKGSAGYGCGLTSEHSEFIIEKDVSWGCGNNSQSSVFSIGRNIGIDCGKGSQNSTYIASTKQTLEQLEMMVPEGNRIVYQPRC